MKASEIEVWARRSLEGVQSRQRVEDFRVELKARWPEPPRAARRLAAHANAAGGERILWVIGVDEGGEVLGADETDLASWWPQVASWFEEVSPTLLRDLAIPVEDKTLVALVFESDWAPYVVRNPAYGSQPGEGVSLEVPWRDGTRTRSARHSELLRVLASAHTLPDYELHGGALSVSRYKDDKSGEEEAFWKSEIRLYVLPEETVVIPFYRCTGRFEVPESEIAHEFGRVSLWSPRDSAISTMSDEVVVGGPGFLYVNGSLYTPPPERDPLGQAEVHFRLQPVWVDVPISISLELAETEAERPLWVRWERDFTPRF